ncbi:MAG TPA: hypothetical protein VFB76_03610 [Candidatus Angelobacter sp.]|nr:hypothetical protein [Candidatus Angelobacter sp.]
MDLALRPMSTSQVLDRTFYLYRNNFVLFAGIAIITPTLKLIALLIQLNIFGPITVPQQPEAMTPQFMEAFFIRMVIASIVGAIVYLVGTALASSATAYAVSMVHLGKTTTIAESYSKIKHLFGRIIGLLLMISLITFGPLLASYALVVLAALSTVMLVKGGGSPGAGIVMALVLMLGGLALIVGAIVWIFFALCRYALAVPACTLEGLPVMVSIRRSRFLTNRAKGGILGIILLTALMTFILSYVLQLPALIANNSMFMTAKTHLSILATVWIYIADFLGGAVAGPIATIALVLVYYDQRVRKEAFDLQLMMEAVGQQTLQPMAAAAPPTIG